ncbi:MAG: response regulator [Candidatus Diapherotrites archaeon]|nr:response regulator [Candidatus Diapherotrites archaeon]
MTQKTALVLDDRETHLREVAKSLEKDGYAVTCTQTLATAKQKATEAKTAGNEFDLIVSDFDLGGKLHQKYRWFDGYRFVAWCKKNGLKSKIILHSTAFEPHKRIQQWLHRPIIARAQQKGITVQGKSVLMPSQRPKKRTPRR